MADLLMIASWLFSGNALPRWYVRNVPPVKIGFAGLAANVPLPVSSTKSMFAQNYPNHLMSVMVARNAVSVPWKSICTELPMLKKSMNR